jgi:hypothetical protein
MTDEFAPPRVTIRRYAASQGHDADETVRRLIAVLDTQEVALAIDRLEKGHGLRVRHL